MKQGLKKENYKGHKVLALGGPVLLIFLLFFWLFIVPVNPFLDLVKKRLIFLSVIIVLTGFIDDYLGQEIYKGFCGHLGQLLKGRLTTGTFKILVYFISALYVLRISSRFFPELLINLFLVLLMTNLFNLLDLRPGRSIKFFVLLSMVLLLFVPSFISLFGPVFLVIVPYLYFEFREKIMLGDSGANLLGVILGYSFTFWSSLGGRFFLTLLLLFLNILSEKFSFSQYIAQNRVLNWLDELGRVRK